jgi:hypothetical protein
MPIKIAVPVTFSDRDVALIAKAIDHANPHRLALLPKVLRSWAEIDLFEYASIEASRASIPHIADQCKRVARHAAELGKALDVMAEDNYQVLIASEMRRGHKSLTAQQRRGHYTKKLADQRTFLSELTIATLSLERKLKRGPGQPRNTASVFVLLDIARIFEWLTEVTPSREVSRVNGEDTGPFHKFASSIWPPVFASATDGLSAAMKDWASGRESHSSALMANIDLRQPSWRVFGH